MLYLSAINAYNQVERSTVLEETARHFPECLAWVKTCYGAPSVLKFGPADILSALGLHQGDPLAGLLFCLALKPVVDAIEAQVPTLSLNASFFKKGALEVSFSLPPTQSSLPNCQKVLCGVQWMESTTKIKIRCSEACPR